MASVKEGLWSHAAKGAAKAVGGLVGTGVVLWLWDWLRDALLAAAAGIWWHLSQSYTLKMWQLYLLAMWSILMTTVWAVRLIAASKLSVRRFTQFRFLGARWRWTYDMSGRPMQLSAFCRNCDMRLVYESDEPPYLDGQATTTFFCEGCGTRSCSFDGYTDDAQGRVLREIERLIRTGEWRSLAAKPSEEG